MDRMSLLGVLPKYRGTAQLIRADQSVGDIMREVKAAHKLYSRDYDAITSHFDFGDNEIRTLEALFSFLKQNVKYKEESEHRQTSKSPAALLATATGDCKHYALFIGGVLDALNRKGKNFDWWYRFASYSPMDGTPGHVFVVVRINGREVWVDPVLSSFNARTHIPTRVIDKKISNMALYRVSGVTEFPFSESPSDGYDQTLTPDVEEAIRKLLHYGVLNVNGQVNDRLLLSLQSKIPFEDFTSLVNARKLIHQAAIGGFFDGIWRGIKKVALLIPRNAYLSLVGLNIFGTATKLERVLNDPEGKKKLEDKWYSLGGTFSKLENTIRTGARKKAVLGAATVGEPVSAAAIIATASAIIAALKPIIDAVMKKQGIPEIDPAVYPYGVCDDGVTPRNADGSCTPLGGGGGAGDFLQKYWPFIVGGGVLIYALSKKK